MTSLASGSGRKSRGAGAPDGGAPLSSGRRRRPSWRGPCARIPELRGRGVLRCESMNRDGRWARREVGRRPHQDGRPGCQRPGCSRYVMRALSTEGGKRAVLVSFRAFIRATGHDAWEAVGPDAGARVCLPLVGTSFHELAVERAQAVPDDQEVQRGRELSGDEQRGQRPGGPGSRSGIGGSFTDRHHGSDESYGTSSWEGAAVATLSRSHRHSRRGRLPTRLSRCRVPT